MVSRITETKRTALHLAARYGKGQCIGILVKQGADMEAEDKDKMTPIALAGWKGHCNVIKSLIALGANKKTVGRKNLENIDECLKGKVLFPNLVYLNHFM